jgi:iron complex outermembrane recepter protein
MKQQHPPAHVAGCSWRGSRQATSFFVHTLAAIAAAIVLLDARLGRANAAEVESASLVDLGIEELLNLEITSVSRKQTRLNNSAAAVAVLTQEDIRRLGATSIPEALRAVPGMQVARINANAWAITARGFNNQFANKLLVMVDGRTVYTPTFAGVYWDVQDMVLQDLEQIEIIRGPGATLWGANAVNGVINIISKSAKDTQGGLVSGGYGTEDRPGVSARYGGQLATNLFYRVYVKYFNREGFEDRVGQSMGDDWNMAQGGFRFDWEAAPADTFTLQGDYYGGETGETVAKTAALPVTAVDLDVASPKRGGNILGRWTHRFSDESEFRLQTYYDYYTRKHAFGGGAVAAGADFLTADGTWESRDTWDLDLQQHFQLLPWNDVVIGAGIRHSRDTLDSRGTEIIPAPAQAEETLYSAFVQDDITVLPEVLHLTLGTKLEHNDMTGFEVEPSGKLLWTPTTRQAVWASVSRAVRTPSRLERDARVNLTSGQLPDGTPFQIPYFGDPNLESEKQLAYEIGYRIEPTRRLSFDVACFYNDYEFIYPAQTPSQLEPTPVPHLLLQPYVARNGLEAHTCGTELLVQWLATDRWRLTAGYSYLKITGPGARLLQSDPEHQFQLRSTLELGAGWETHVAWYYVDRITAAGAATSMDIPAYFRLDLGVAWRVNQHVELSLWGQNLLDDSHPEFAGYKTTRVAEVPRTFYGACTWRF